MADLTILMPCLNEAKTIAYCLQLAKQYAARSEYDVELLVADNGSTDDSIAIAEGIGARVIHVRQRGYGAALIAGIKAARGRWIIFGDSDGSYDFSAIDTMVERLAAGADLVMGDRFSGGIESGAMPFLHRYLGNPVLSQIGRLLYSSRVKDFHCGIRGLNRERFVDLDLSAPGMEFASEIVVRAELAGFHIEQVPVVLKPDLRDRPPHLNTWRDGWRHLRFLLALSPEWSLLLPGLALMALGLLMQLSIATAPLDVFGVRLDIHTMLYGAGFLVVGFQLVVCALLVCSYWIRVGVRKEAAWYARFRSVFSADVAVGLGVILVLIGVLIGGAAFMGWGRDGFGNLDPVDVMRLVIPSVCLIAVGVQAVCLSVCLSLIVNYQTTPEVRSVSSSRPVLPAGRA